ncbi:MAG: hypothetical protein Q8S73_22290 [Deltaproteobacteria bacterium]|jgi:hypothetical protein|nr:hypothetical protein [Myxococcales bacterium]MDP3216856.1 hypothetical protein [Deltaproteobacteria bacterium]
MRRRSARDPDPATGSPALPLALAVAVLAVLGFSRWWVTRPAPPEAPVPLDAGSYVTAIAPALRRAGCATPACHGGAAPMRLDPSPTHAAAMLAELDAVRPFAGRGDPSQSPLWLRATSAAHAGAGAFGAASCEARALARWIAGAAVRSCPAPLPPPLR